MTNADSTVNRTALAARLSALTGRNIEIRDCRRASTGFANATWLVEADPEPLAIKVQLTPSCVYQRNPRIEPAALASLAGTAVPVPHLVACDAAGEVFGAPWFAMTVVDGRGVPDDPFAGYAGEGWFAEAEPTQRRELWNDFTDRLADLHNLPAETFAAIGRGGNHSAMLEYWIASLHDVARPRFSTTRTRALEWLRAAMPADADVDPRPCMGDARMANVLERNGRTAALVDWEVVHVGNPRGDLAYHLYLDGRYARVTGQRLEGLPSHEDTWHRWEDRTGLAAGNTGYWQLFAATWFAVTATRMMVAVHGMDAETIEAINPMIPDVERRREEVGA